MLQGFRVDPATGGERVDRLAFLLRGPVEVTLRSRLTFLIGENGSGKTTLLEALAADCAIRPTGGGSYAETEDREPAAISAAMQVFTAGRPPGLLLRADRFAETMARDAVVRDGRSQAIVATHSPILTSHSGADLF